MASQNMKLATWVRNYDRANFARSERKTDVNDDRLEVDRKELPGPNHYQNISEIFLSNKERNYGSRFGKAQRKTAFDSIE